MMLVYTFLSWLILWINWMNRMSPDNLSINLCQTSNLDSRQFSHLNKRFSVETTEKSQIMIIDSTFYEEYQHQCWRNKNPWQRSWQRYRGGVDPVLIPDLRQLLLVDLNVPHGHLQHVPLRIISYFAGYRLNNTRSLKEKDNPTPNTQSLSILA